MTSQPRIENYVVPNPSGYELAGSSRQGFVHATPEEFAAVFGGAHDNDPGGDKVTIWWHFETPRGRATVRDYYDHERGLLSIASHELKAARWLACFLRHNRLRAYTGRLKTWVKTND